MDGGVEGEGVVDGGVIFEGGDGVVPDEAGEGEAVGEVVVVVEVVGVLLG